MKAPLLPTLLIYLTLCATVSPGDDLRAAPPMRQFTSHVALGKLALKTASVRIGDLNGDHHLDIIVANGRHWPAQNAWFPNNGKGRFTNRIPLGKNPDRSYAVPLADLDSDGDLDLVVGNDRQPSLIWLNDSRGTFPASTPLAQQPQPTRNVTL
ncbi:MAG: VCBS repeat-containing protein, partial [Planctomycetaceae bacterium]|nr:VCBS repeat-containing protein [Planctomycetaceae bacterium]